MNWYAHSAKGEKPPQTYRDHIVGVVATASRNVQELSPFVGEERTKQYLPIVQAAALYHDLGKLNKDNQTILSGRGQAARLPVEHRDAGVKYLIGSHLQTASATLVYAHHFPGLPNLIEEIRETHPFRFVEAMKDSDTNLEKYINIHRIEVGDAVAEPDFTMPGKKLKAMEYRVLLSCLVDADYADSADMPLPHIERRWPERLQKLDQYVKQLQEMAIEPDSERNRLRATLYHNCRNASVDEPLEYCDSPVGTGKTTAVVAHMLKSAVKNGLRHIFVVLPYTNIISQTVRVLREALVLEGENPEEIVAEHHHQADFENLELRHLATTWSAPVIVTTAVQFFETLAGNLPAKLRKLHQLPGSGVILDEFHAALPTKLLPVAWKWITELSEQWGCRFCFCSATSVAFWDNPIFKQISTAKVAPLLDPSLGETLNRFEKGRIRLNVLYEAVPHFEGAKELIEFLDGFHGSRLIVLNTVQSAAYLANMMKKNGHDVLHLSTALTPRDREKIVQAIKRRLDPNTNYPGDWTLVATSCIECGMDFSFQNGFCEMRSYSSCIQLGGRVSRNGEYPNASLIAFTITESGFGYNPEFADQKKVFIKLIESGILSSIGTTQAVTQSFDMECKLMGGLPDELCKLDRNCYFKEVADKFKVISDDAITVVADRDLAAKIRNGEKVNAIELQKGSVRIRRKVAEKLGCHDGELPILGEGQYDSFLGYMKGLIDP